MGGASGSAVPHSARRELNQIMLRADRADPVVIDSVLGPGEVPRPSAGGCWWAALAIATAIFALVVLT